MEGRIRRCYSLMWLKSRDIEIGLSLLGVPLRLPKDVDPTQVNTRNALKRTSGIRRVPLKNSVSSSQSTSNEDLEVIPTASRSTLYPVFSRRSKRGEAQFQGKKRTNSKTKKNLSQEWDSTKNATGSKALRFVSKRKSRNLKEPLTKGNSEVGNAAHFVKIVKDLMSEEEDKMIKDEEGICGLTLRNCVLGNLLCSQEADYFHLTFGMQTEVEEILKVFLSILEALYKKNVKDVMLKRYTSFVGRFLEVHEGLIEECPGYLQHLKIFTDSILEISRELSSVYSDLVYKISTLKHKRKTRGSEIPLSLKNISLLETSASDIAEQLCLLDHQTLSLIPFHHYIASKWKNSPQVNTYMNLYNKIASWTEQEIEEAPDKCKSKVITQLIGIAYVLLQIQDFHGMMGIVTGILRKIDDNLLKTKKLEKMHQIALPLNNFSSLRKLIKVSKPPLVYPAILIIKDLSVVEENLETWVDGPHKIINSHKMKVMGKILENIKNSLGTPYPFETKPDIEHFLSYFLCGND